MRSLSLSSRAKKPASNLPKRSEPLTVRTTGGSHSLICHNPFQVGASIERSEEVRVAREVIRLTAPCELMLSLRLPSILQQLDDCCLCPKGVVYLSVLLRFRSLMLVMTASIALASHSSSSASPSTSASTCLRVRPGLRAATILIAWSRLMSCA
jgi:hypothetical protein